MPRNQTETIQYTIAILVLIAFAIILIVFYRNSPASKVPIIFSERDLLASLWREYKNEYLEQGTFRTIDRQRDNVTTSEGQSYTMLRAVWMDDQEIFDNSLEWAENNLGREEDALFSWIFGLKEDGSYGVLTSIEGQNSASDANSDIAVALIFAYGRWGSEEYLNKAREIVRDMWELEVLEINGAPVLLANDVEKKFSTDYVVVNPSYFSPYAYRMFARLDPENPWEDLVDNSYRVLEESIQSELDKDSSAGIPPDWILMDRESGEIVAPDSNSGLTTNYSYDALRTAWRLALDYQWFNEPRAKELLEQMSFISNEWEDTGRLYDRYKHDGTRASSGESFAMYGGSIGQPLITNPSVAREIYRKKLISNFNPDSGEWRSNLSYYDTNWVWFGIGLYSGELLNLGADISPEALRGEESARTNTETT
ncbi:MAG: glycosyl hydrolase family 8, partial [Candidatus Paceibacterota bacterium]